MLDAISTRLLCMFSLAATMVITCGPTTALAQTPEASPQPACVANFTGSGSTFKGFTYSSYVDIKGTNADQVFVSLGRAMAADGVTINNANKDLGTISASIPVIGKANETVPLNGLVTQQGPSVRAKLTATFAPFLITNHNSVRDEFCKYFAAIPGGKNAASTTEHIGSPNESTSAASTYPAGTTLSTSACKWYVTWYSKQNRGLRAGLFQYAESMEAGAKNNARLSSDSLPTDFAQASGFKDPHGAGSGFCGAVFFDRAHNVALTLSHADTTQTIELLTTQSPIAGVTKRDLSQTQTGRGVRLGMTPRQVQLILGPAKVKEFADGSGIVYLSRHPKQPQGLYDVLSLGFINNRLVYIAWYEEFA